MIVRSVHTSLGQVLNLWPSGRATGVFNNSKHVRVGRITVVLSYECWQWIGMARSELSSLLQSTITSLARWALPSHRLGSQLSCTFEKEIQFPVSRSLSLTSTSGCGPYYLRIFWKGTFSWARSEQHIAIPHRSDDNLCLERIKKAKLSVPCFVSTVDGEPRTFGSQRSNISRD